ncbi:sarcosine/dimethylglycine N-methyltransferase, partial [Lecanoromycetidae sp. Uapishka_2]
MAITDTTSAATSTARTYYNSTDADTFYHTIWGGSHINIGIYPPSPSTSSISSASLHTIQRMAYLISPLTSSTRILDLGSGYGGAARYLARKYGCHVTCLNLSEVENERNREANKQEGLDGLVQVVEGNFEDLPFGSGEFDVVWSQDAFLHSSDRARVVEEIDRVLVEGGGKVVFTDPVAAQGVDSKELGPILQRLQLESLGSVALYRKEFKMRGFVDVGFEDHSEQLAVHYGRVLEELNRGEEELKGRISDEYIRNLKVGLAHWVEGGKSGKLAWGILQFER